MRETRRPVHVYDMRQTFTAGPILPGDARCATCGGELIELPARTYSCESGESSHVRRPFDDVDRSLCEAIVELVADDTHLSRELVKAYLYTEASDLVCDLMHNHVTVTVPPAGPVVATLRPEPLT